MKRSLVLLLCVVAGILFVSAASWAAEEEVIAAMVKARGEVKPIPNPASQIADLDVKKAYEVQKKLITAFEAKGEKVGGFKAGLTTEATQKRFGVSSPLLAPMFKSGELGDKAVVKTKGFVKPFLETEIGYVVGRRIDKPVKDVASLKKAVKEVFPAVELPDLRFADLKGVKGVDLIADGVGAARYIVGKKMPADKVDVANIKVTLTLDGKVVNTGTAPEALGDQWKALLWLVNGAVEQGWTLEPGYVFITGALGKMIPCKPGSYKGDWGPLGTLSFTVE